MPTFEKYGFQRLPTEEENEDGTNQAPPQVPRYQLPPPQPYCVDPNRGPEACVLVPQYVVAPSGQTMKTVQEPRPTDWTIPAILSCLFCCWPFGLLAIIFATEASNLASRGDMVKARQNARTAKILTITSVVVGLLILGGVMVAAVMNTEPPANDLQDRTTISPWH